MQFFEKLHYLMNVQNITNNRLAKALSLDPSLISRWRSGTRVPAKNSDYIEKIASYFAAQAHTNYQKAALFELIGVPNMRKAELNATLSDLLKTWLLDKPSTESALVNSFLNKLHMIRNSKPVVTSSNVMLLPSKSQEKIEHFQGICGKREGSLQFLSDIANHSAPCTLLLYSDESMEWLTGDKEFYVKWGSLLAQVLSKGNRIKIIHTLQRSLSELLSAIDRWLPLYMSGLIEPYFYPGYHDSLFKRTMFIAPGIAALTSTALAEHTASTEQLYFRDKEVIARLGDEFNSFLSMCLPLMRIFANNNVFQLSKVHKEFDLLPGNTLRYANHLSSLTLPQALLICLLEKTTLNASEKEAFISLWKEKRELFMNNLKQYPYTEIIHENSLISVLENNSTTCRSDWIPGMQIPCVTNEYAEHIQNTIRIMKENPNYRVFVQNKSLPDSIDVCVKEGTGVMVTHQHEPSIVFTFNEQNLTRAFQTYINEILRAIPKKEMSIASLEQWYHNTIKTQLRNSC